MMSSLHDALCGAGAEAGSVRCAVEEVAACNDRFSRLDSDAGLLRWMVGFNLVMTAAVLAKLLT